jgi:hypothetical protein
MEESYPGGHDEYPKPNTPGMRRFNRMAYISALVIMAVFGAAFPYVLWEIARECVTNFWSAFWSIISVAAAGLFLWVFWSTLGEESKDEGLR